MKSHQVPELAMLLVAFSGKDSKKPCNTTHTQTFARVPLHVSTSRHITESIRPLWLVSLSFKYFGLTYNTSETKSNVSLWDKWEQCTSCETKETHSRRPYEERRDGIEEPLYLRQGGACLLTEVTTGREGWGRMGGEQHRCGWLWMEWAKESGWRHGGVYGTDTDNKEKPGHPSSSTYVLKPLYVLGLFR